MILEKFLKIILSKYSDIIKYPMAGMKSHHVSVGIFNINTSKTIYLDTGEPKEQYLTNICWGQKDKYIYIAVLNRDQSHLKLNQYSAQDGSFIKTLFEFPHYFCTSHTFAINIFFVM